MKEIIKALNVQHQALLKVVSKRIETYNDRTDFWKGSKKGDFYHETTESIKDEADCLLEVITSLKLIN